MTSLADVARQLACLVPLLALAGPAPAADELCPRAIATRQQLDGDLKGWESYTRVVKHVLRDVQMFEGHPSGTVSLHPDEREQEGKPVAQWRLHAEAEYWVQCGYSGTSVALARRLPPGVTRCEVAWAPRYREVEALRCTKAGEPGGPFPARLDTAGRQAAEVIHQYVSRSRSWKRGEYRIEDKGSQGNLAFYWIVHVDDDRLPHPGGGKSFAVEYDRDKEEVVRELAFQ